MYIYEKCVKNATLLVNISQYFLPGSCHMDELGGSLVPLDHQVWDDPVDILQEHQLTSGVKGTVSQDKHAKYLFTELYYAICINDPKI